MAPKRGIKRKDKSRVVLKKGESQRKDGTYDYRWTSRNGRRHSIYAQTLEELRIKEDAITRDEMDGIRAEARCTTLNELFEVWAQVKRGLKDNTLICTPFTGHPVEGVLLCGTHMSTKGNV